MTSLVENSGKLTDIFGCWPSFHDAEVLELTYWRGAVKPGDWDDSNVFPVLTVKLLILGATQRNFAVAPDAVATIRFHDVEDFKMDGFNHVNQIVELSIIGQEPGVVSTGTWFPQHLVVTFEPGFGMQASFRCFRIEVVDAMVQPGSHSG